ncbi:MAG: HAD family hydrolase [Candidatus Bathyarchaeota archaeon]|jgi:putative hydrolase of the HAD superfamily
MAQIEVISFDMEGTLITHDFSDLIWETDIPRLYGEQNRLDLETARKRVIAQYDVVGDGRPEWYDAGYWFRKLNLECDLRDILEVRRNSCILYPDVLGILEDLREDYRLVISSNTIREFLDVQLRILPDVFEKVFSAPSDLGIVKDQKFYRHVCDELMIKPQRITHIGDSRKFDYDPSKAIGIHAFLLDRENKLVGPDVVHDLESYAEIIKRFMRGSVS